METNNIHTRKNIMKKSALKSCIVVSMVEYVKIKYYLSFFIFREEGFRALFNGVSMATTRGIMVTIGQLSFYDQFKQMLLATGRLMSGARQLL